MESSQESASGKTFLRKLFIGLIIDGTGGLFIQWICDAEHAFQFHRAPEIERISGKLRNRAAPCREAVEIIGVACDEAFLFATDAHGAMLVRIGRDPQLRDGPKAPVLLDIIRDVEELCPNAIVLNYTNPMAMLVSYLQTQTDLKVTGLCHSVQGTAAMLAGWLGLKKEELDYTCVGINHQAFYLELKHDGQDMYPALREAVKRPEVANEEPVRIEMFKYLKYFPTESSGHNSEYNPWFRKRPDLIEKYCTHGTGWNPGEYAYILKEYMDREDTWEKEYSDWLGSDDIDLERGEEYASNIFNAIYGDHEPYPFNANLRNQGYVTNIDEGACVEVPVISDQDGIHVLGQWTLPAHLDALVLHSAKLEEMAVQAAINGDPELVFQAVLQDPLTASVCSMEEIHDMVQEMLLQNKDYLGYFKTLTI